MNIFFISLFLSIFTGLNGWLHTNSFWRHYGDIKTPLHRSYNWEIHPRQWVHHSISSIHGRQAPSPTEPLRNCYTKADCCLGDCKDGYCKCIEEMGDCNTAPDCCKGECTLGKCQCSVVAATCATNDDCCNNICNSTLCECRTLGQACTDDVNCCTGYCSDDKVCICATVGITCLEHSKCCSNNCDSDNGVCACNEIDANEPPCGTDADCCTGQCGDDNKCSCADLDATCESSADCCQQNCDNNVCSCIPNGSPINCGDEDDNCCGDYCDRATDLCTCKPLKKNCKRNDQCCSGRCNNKCVKIGKLGEEVEDDEY